MKTSRLLVCAALLLGLSVPAFAVIPTAKRASYAVVGYYRGAVPAPALIQKALDEIKPRMKNFVHLQNPKEADQVVNVSFKGDRYEINYDPALDRISNEVERFEFEYRVANMQNDQGMPASSQGTGGSR